MQCNIEYLVTGHILYLISHIKFIYWFKSVINESNGTVKHDLFQNHLFTLYSQITFHLTILIKLKQVVPWPAAGEIF